MVFPSVEAQEDTQCSGMRTRVYADSFVLVNHGMISGRSVLLQVEMEFAEV